MDEREMKLEARLAAIEYILSDLCVKWYMLANASNAKVEAAHTDTIERLTKQSFPGLDPAMGDAFSSELEEAVAHILSMQRAMLADLNKKLGRS